VTSSPVRYAAGRHGTTVSAYFTRPIACIGRFGYGATARQHPGGTCEENESEKPIADVFVPRVPHGNR
jgi:hypothetical protein